MINACSLTKTHTRIYFGFVGFYTVQHNSLIRLFGEAWSLNLQSDWIWFRSVLQLNDAVILKTDKYTTDPNYVLLGYPHLRYNSSIHQMTTAFCKKACLAKLNAMLLSHTLTYFCIRTKSHILVLIRILSLIHSNNPNVYYITNILSAKVLRENID